MADLGRGLEAIVFAMLVKLCETKKILGFRYNEPNSPEDLDGKDFAIFYLDKNGEENIANFGVTISLRSWHRAKLNHSDTPQFCFPIGTNPATMEATILKLCV